MFHSILFCCLLSADIDECRNPEITDECEFGCVNTIGSYRCAEQPERGTSTAPAMVTPTTPEGRDEPDLSPIKTCGDGFILDNNNNCVDIDECAEGGTECDYCQNTHGGYSCICPTGIYLASSVFRLQYLE